MNKHFKYIFAFLVAALVMPSQGRAFWTAKNDVKESSKQDKSEPKKKPAQAQANAAAPARQLPVVRHDDYIDIGNPRDEDETEEEKKLKEYGKMIQREVRDSKEGTAASQMAAESKNVKSVEASRTPGLEDYKTVRTIQPLQRTGNPLKAVEPARTAQPVTQALRVQAVSNQAKKVAQAASKTPAPGQSTVDQ